MERSGIRRRRVQFVVLSLVAGGTFIVGSPTSRAFHESTVSSSLSTVAGVCPPADFDDAQSAPNARSFDDEIESNAAAMHAETKQDTSISGTTYLTVRSTGSTIVR